MAGKEKQLEFPFKFRGGKRKGAGRKPKGEKAGVSHAKRAKVRSSDPVLVTVKLVAGLASLRTKESSKASIR